MYIEVIEKSDVPVDRALKIVALSNGDTVTTLETVDNIKS